MLCVCLYLPEKQVCCWCVDSKAETSIITPQTIDPHQQQQRKLEIPPAVSFMLQNIYGPRLKSCKVKNGTCSTHSNLSPFIHLLCCVRNASKSFNNACAPDCITLLQKSRKLGRKKKVSIVIHDFLRGFSNLATWFHLIRYDKKLSRHAFCQHPKDHDKIEKRSVTWTKKRSLAFSFVIYGFCSLYVLIQFWFYSTCHSWGFYSYFLTHTCFSDFLLLLL